MNKFIRFDNFTPEGNKLFNKLKLRQLSEQPFDCAHLSLATLHVIARRSDLTPAKLSTYESNS